MKHLWVCGLLFVSAATAFGQGDNPNKPSRLEIKRAMDDDSGKLSGTPKKITIEEMLGLARPIEFKPDISNPEVQNKRFGPFETTLWEVEATITEIVKRA